MANRKTVSQKALEKLSEEGAAGADKDSAVSMVDFLFLVVDDDDGARQMTVDYLRSFGFERVIEAKTGIEALSIIQKTKIDFIISDWEMPGKNGLEVLQTLKGNPQYAHIPFIIVTSPKSHERLKIEDAALSNVDGYIIKPFRSQVLREKIDHALIEKSFREKKGALIVDDDDEVRALVVEFLKSMGYSPIYQAKDGDEGYGALQLHFNDIAVVISDWEMPKLAGIDLLRRLRSEPKYQEVPFVMITSQSSIERLKLKRAIESDVDHYLLKPFRAADLKSKVDYVLSRAKAGQEVKKEITRAQAYLSEGRYGEAEKCFQHVLSLEPSNVASYVGLANVQIKLAPQKGLEKAIQFIRRAISINPNFVPAHIELALAFESAMSLEKAIVALRDALKLNGLSEDINFHLGRLLLRRGREQEAVAFLQRALELNPDMQSAKELLTDELKERTTEKNRSDG